MKRLLIVGAGGHGRCCLDIAREHNTYHEISFLDDNAAGKCINDALVIGRIESLSEYTAEYQDVFVAIGNNALRKALIAEAEALGYNMVSLISLQAVVSDFARIGKGSVIFPGTVVEANANLGEGCIVAANATINHDAIIHEYSLVNSNTVIRPNTDIGELSSIGSRCVITFGKTVEAGSVVSDGQVV